jgi:hypothetical protein
MGSPGIDGPKTVTNNILEVRHECCIVALQIASFLFPNIALTLVHTSKNYFLGHGHLGDRSGED